VQHADPNRLGLAAVDALVQVLETVRFVRGEALEHDARVIRAAIVHEQEADAGVCRSELPKRVDGQPRCLVVARNYDDRLGVCQSGTGYYIRDGEIKCVRPRDSARPVSRSSAAPLQLSAAKSVAS
jgi:hypothetical protein